MPRRPCLGTPPAPGHPPTCPTHAIAPLGRSRCDDCDTATKRTQEANRPPRDKARYHGTWPTLARQTIATHRATHGDICPGWEREPHPIIPDQWVCDHDAGPMCRSCNGRKAATHDRARATQQRQAAEQ